MKEIRNISVAGAGTMGYSLAQAFAKFGYPVKLYDLFPAALEKAKKLIAINQSAEVEAGNLTAEESEALCARISFTADLNDLADTDFLVEAILEKLERPLTASALHSYLKRLEEKGYLSCQKQGKVNAYTPLISREQYQEQTSRSVLDRLYEGSLSRFAAALTGGKKLSKEDIAELEAFLETQKGGKG